MTEYAKDQDWVWDRYWQFDRIASCFDVKGSNYPPEIEQEWNEFFANLPGNSAILDVCTGNGAIARFAAKYAQENKKQFAIIGIDKADIDPKKFARKSEGEKLITFKGKVKAEALLFPDNSFDAVISHYGFEYTNHAKTLDEIARVLKSGGRAKLITHAAEGSPAQNAKAEIGKIRFLIHDLDIFTKASIATEAAWQIGRAAPLERMEMQAKIMPKLQAFRDAMKKLAEKLKGDPENPVLHATYGLLHHTFEVHAQVDLETLLDKINETKLEARAHLGRIEALIAAALSKEDAQAITHAAEHLGFGEASVEPFTLEAGKKLVGWNLNFTALAQFNNSL